MNEIKIITTPYLVTYHDGSRNTMFYARTPNSNNANNLSFNQTTTYMAFKGIEQSDTRVYIMSRNYIWRFPLNHIVLCNHFTIHNKLKPYQVRGVTHEFNQNATHHKVVTTQINKAKQLQDEENPYLGFGM